MEFTHSVPLGEGALSLKLHIFSLVVDHRDDLPNEKNHETDDHSADDDAQRNAYGRKRILLYYIFSRLLNRVACQRDQRTMTLRRFPMNYPLLQRSYNNE